MVLVMTAHEDMQSAVGAMKEGALDYLVKPVDLDALEALLERAIRDRALAARVRRQREGATEEDGVDTLIGRDPAMIGIYKLIGVLAKNRATVLKGKPVPARRGSPEPFTPSHRSRKNPSSP